MIEHVRYMGEGICIQPSHRPDLLLILISRPYPVSVRCNLYTLNQELKLSMLLLL